MADAVKPVVVTYEIYTRLTAPADLGPLEVQLRFENAVRVLEQGSSPTLCLAGAVVEKVRVASMYFKREEAAP